jgi:hypothetical protein
VNRYAVSGKSAATAATIDNAAAGIWNPSAVKPIFVRKISIFKVTAGAGDEPKLRRTSARGTATTTATPTIENHLGEELAPVSGFLLDLAYSAQPTFLGTSGTGGDLESIVLPAAIGCGMVWVFDDPIRVKAGTGLAIVTGIALAMPALRVTYVVDE